MPEPQREGIAKAKAEGKYTGRPVSLDATAIRTALAEGESRRRWRGALGWRDEASTASWTRHNARVVGQYQERDCETGMSPWSSMAMSFLPWAELWERQAA